jgi:hypothetical protein
MSDEIACALCGRGWSEHRQTLCCPDGKGKWRAGSGCVPAPPSTDYARGFAAGVEAAAQQALALRNENARLLKAMKQARSCFPSRPDFLSERELESASILGREIERLGLRALASAPQPVAGYRALPADGSANQGVYIEEERRAR